MNKKIISFVVAMALAFSAFGQSFAATNPTVKVNNKTAVCPAKAKPYTTKNNLMVPVRAVAELMGATVKSLGATKEVSVVYGNTKIVYKLNTANAIVNGTVYTMTDKVVVKSGSTYVPARFLAEKLGATYKWDSKAMLATVNVKAQKPITAPANTATSIPKAKTAFMPYQPELSPVDTKIIEELKKYPENKDVPASSEIPGGYGSNEALLKYWGEPTAAEWFLKPAKGWVETRSNADYRSIDENFFKRMRYYYTPGGYGGTIQQYLKNYTESIIKGRVVVKSEFLTDTSLIYQDKSGRTAVRGRELIMFSSANSEFFEKNNMKKLELNKWYYRDIEVKLGLLATTPPEDWEHSSYTYTGIVVLSDYREAKE